MTQITGLNVFPIAVPPNGFGSDPRNPNPIYSAAVLELQTDTPGLVGDSFIFTIGIGVCELTRFLECTARNFVFGTPGLVSTVEELAAGPMLGRFCRQMVSESHYNWLGVGGVSRMTIGAVANALWDLCAKSQSTTGWQFLVEKSPEDLLEFVDFTHIVDFLSPAEALEMLRRAQPGKDMRAESLYRRGPAAYNTAGWSALPDDLLVPKTREMLEQSWPQIKLKVGANYSSAGLDAAVSSDLVRLIKVFDTIRRSGRAMKVAMDCNQIFDPVSAADYITRLALSLDDAGAAAGAEFRLAWFEEPTHPASALGHRQVKSLMRRRLRESGREDLAVPIATGEHCPSLVTFKDMLAGTTEDFPPIDIVQPDYSRLGGIGDLIAVVLMARKAGTLICPHAGGIGLCEGVANLQAFHEALFGAQEGAVLEFVEGGLHEGVYQHPASVVNGHYVLPRGAVGNATALTESARRTYGVPDGDAWRIPENRDWAARLVAGMKGSRDAR